MPHKLNAVMTLENVFVASYCTMLYTINIQYTYLLYINNVQTIHISIFSYFLRQNLKDTMTRHHYLCILSDYGNNMMSSINFTFNNNNWYDNI